MTVHEELLLPTSAAVFLFTDRSLVPDSVLLGYTIIASNLCKEQREVWRLVKSSYQGSLLARL